MNIWESFKNFFAVKIISVKFKLSGDDAPTAVYFSNKEKAQPPHKKGEAAK